eukprot:g5303.t1
MRFKATKGYDDPLLQKLVQEKIDVGTQIAMKTGNENVLVAEVPAASGFSAEDVSLVKRSLRQLQGTEAGAKLYEKLVYRMSKKSIDNAAEFKKPFFELRKGVIALQKLGKEAWGKIRRTCDEDSRSQTARVAELESKSDKVKLGTALEAEAFGARRVGEAAFNAGLTAKCREKAVAYATKSLAQKSQLAALKQLLGLTNNLEILKFVLIAHKGVVSGNVTNVVEKAPPAEPVAQAKEVSLKGGKSAVAPGDQLNTTSNFPAGLNILKKMYGEKAQRIAARKEELAKAKAAKEEKIRAQEEKVELAETAHNKAVQDRSKTLLLMLNSKEDLYHHRKECEESIAELEKIENQTAQLRNDKERAKMRGMDLAEEAAEDEDVVTQLANKVANFKVLLHQTAQNLTAATHSVKDAEHALTGENTDKEEARWNLQLQESRVQEQKLKDEITDMRKKSESALLAYNREKKLDDIKKKHALALSKQGLSVTPVNQNHKLILLRERVDACNSKELQIESKIEGANQTKITHGGEVVATRVALDRERSILNKMQIADKVQVSVINEPIPQQAPIFAVACGLYLSPQECTMDAGCGYIPGSGCFAGTKDGPYFFDGDISKWEFDGVEGSACADYGDCGQCTKAGCGWCGARLTCTEGSAVGPSVMDTCPPEYMSQWVHQLGRGVESCPVRHVVQTESKVAQIAALKNALTTRSNMVSKEITLHSVETSLGKFKTNNTDGKNSQKIIVLNAKAVELRKEYDNLQGNLKSAVKKLRLSEKGEKGMIGANKVSLGLTPSEMSEAEKSGYTEGLREAARQANKLMGPRGVHGATGLGGETGVSASLDDADKLMAPALAKFNVLGFKEGARRAKIKRWSGVAGRTATGASDNSSMSNGATNSSSGMTGDKLGNVTDSIENSLVADTVNASKGASSNGANKPGSAAGSEKALPAKSALGKIMAAQSDAGADEPEEKISTGPVANVEVLEAKLNAMKEKSAAIEGLWTAQIEQFEAMLAKEAKVCESAKAAALMVTKTEGLKRESQTKLLAEEKENNKLGNAYATKLSEFVDLADKSKIAITQVEDAKLELAKAPQQLDNPQYILKKAALDKAQTELKSLEAQKNTTGYEKDKILAKKKGFKKVFAHLTSNIKDVSALLVLKQAASAKLNEVECPRARKSRTEAQFEADKLKADYDLSKSLVKKQAKLVHATKFRPQSNSSYALSLHGGPYISAGYKGFQVVKRDAKKELTVSISAKLRAFARDGDGFVTLVAAMGGSKTEGWSLGVDESGFVFNFNRLSKEKTTIGSIRSAGKIDVGLNKWYHVMATFTGTKASLFVNGKLVVSAMFPQSSINYNKNSVLSFADRSGRFTVGAMKLGAPVDAVVDNVAVWGRVLSKVEIENGSCKAPSGNALKRSKLLIQYNFGPGIIPGLDVPDVSGNSLDGRIFSPHHAVAPGHARHVTKWVEDAKLGPCRT